MRLQTKSTPDKYFIHYWWTVCLEENRNCADEVSS